MSPGPRASGSPAGFVNRSTELAALDQWWAAPGAGMAVVWGRRRVGKSWLLKHWSADKRAIVFVARNRPIADELAALGIEAARVASPRRRNLAERPFTGWDDVFDTLADAAEDEPLLLVIDEFPELLKVTPGLESELRAIWERVEGTSNLKVILCGSAVRTMEALQGQDSPLYNRMTLRLHVQPFRVTEIAKLLPGADALERASAWGVCGGMPFYLSAWDTDQSFSQNVERLFLNEHGLLLSEGDFVLATEDIAGGKRDRLPEQVMRAIAAGHTSYSAIGSAIGTSPGRALASMEELRLVQRVQPVTERPNTKLSYYRIADNFLAFWLTVIERHRGAVDAGLGASLSNVVAAEFDDFMGARWEIALREYLRIGAADGRFGPDIVDVGEFWLRQTGPAEDPCQLDVVALEGRSRRVAIAGEAKWAMTKSAARLVAATKRKVTDAKLKTTPEVQWLACARDSLTDVPDDCLAVTAHDIFA